MVIKMTYPSHVDAPNIQGYEMGPRLGAGVTGNVFEATRADGKLCAVKVFDVMSSNVGLLANRIARIRESALSGVTVPILGQTLDARPACIVMPIMESNLQLRLSHYFEEEDSWPLVLELAALLDKLHSARVAHGNLKPGNLFFDADGNLLLADYASGLMPEVHRLGYTDAFLYAPPEQLRSPDGYLNEAGYRWDVYAFGVLAFRLLNGIFPRCNELFKEVSPEPGTTKRFHIDADYEGIAKGLQADHLAAWKEEPASDAEKRQRHIIEHCLSLNPLERPSDMMEVNRQLTVITQELKQEAERSAILESERTAHRRRKRMVFVAQVLGVSALGLGGLWQLTQYKRSQEAATAVEEFEFMEQSKDTLIAGLETDILAARDSEKRALTSEQRIQTALDQEQGKSRAHLLSAQVTNDMLMRWLLEKGVSGLPPLQGRQGRLKALANPLRKQLLELESRAGMEDQSAILRLRLAEIYLAGGDLEQGTQALDKALRLGKDHLSDQEIATAQLRKLLLLSENLKEKKDLLAEQLEVTATAIEKAWPTQGARHLLAQAALHLVKGRQAEFLKLDKQALTEYYSALSAYQKLSRDFPESPALYFTTGRVYLSAGQVAEGAGAVDDAVTLRGYAAQQFLKLSKTKEGSTPEVDYQIASATAAQAVSEWQRGKTFDAENLAKTGLGKLSALANKMPGDFRVISDLASQQGIVAMALRDEGKTSQAAKLLKKAIMAMETGLKKNPSDNKARYLYASLQWQMCGILGQQGEGEEEIELGISARDLLREVLSVNKAVPHPYLVRKSLAYLCGDLGHAADLHGDRELAVKLLKESVTHWQKLLEQRPNSPENLEGLAWVKQRLQELGAS